MNKFVQDQFGQYSVQYLENIGLAMEQSDWLILPVAVGPRLYNKQPYYPAKVVRGPISKISQSLLVSYFLSIRPGIILNDPMHDLC